MTRNCHWHLFTVVCALVASMAALGATDSTARVAVRYGPETPLYGATSFALAPDGSAYVLDPIGRKLIWLKDDVIVATHPLAADGLLKSIAFIDGYIVLAASSLHPGSDQLIIGKHTANGLLTSDTGDASLRPKAVMYLKAEVSGHVGRTAILPKTGTMNPAGHEISTGTPDVEIVTTADVAVRGDLRYRYGYRPLTKNTGIIYINDAVPLPVDVPNAIGSVEVLGLLEDGGFAALVEDVKINSAGMIKVVLYRLLYDQDGTPRSAGSFAVVPKTSLASYREVEMDALGIFKTLQLTPAPGTAQPQGEMKLSAIPFKAVPEERLRALRDLYRKVRGGSTQAAAWTMPNNPVEAGRKAVLSEADALLNLKWTIRAHHLEPPVIAKGERASECDSCVPRKITVNGKTIDSFAHCWELPYFLRGKKPAVDIFGAPYAWGRKPLRTKTFAAHEVVARELTELTHSAGHTCTFSDKAGRQGSGSLRGVAGLDCSGFVGAVWNAGMGISTSWIHETPAITARDKLKAGDVINKVGHVVLFKEWATTPKGVRVRAYESSLYCSGVCLRDFRFRELAGYQLRTIERALN